MLQHRRVVALLLAGQLRNGRILPSHHRLMVLLLGPQDADPLHLPIVQRPRVTPLILSLSELLLNSIHSHVGEGPPAIISLVEHNRTTWLHFLVSATIRRIFRPIHLIIVANLRDDCASKTLGYQGWFR